jgi:hypothetical protein
MRGQGRTPRTTRQIISATLGDFIDISANQMIGSRVVRTMARRVSEREMTSATGGLSA